MTLGPSGRGWWRIWRNSWGMMPLLMLYGLLHGVEISRWTRRRWPAGLIAGVEGETREAFTGLWALFF